MPLIKCFKDCQKELFKPGFSDMVKIFFSDMTELPLFKGVRLRDNVDHNNIKCILQYLFWETKGNKCIPCPCDLCGKNNGIIMGHIISRDNGGTYNLENLLWTCQSCEDKIGQNNIQLKDVKNHNLLKNKYQKIYNFIEKYNKKFTKDKHIHYNYNFGLEEIPVVLQKKVLPQLEFKIRENQRKLLDNFRQVSDQGSFGIKKSKGKSRSKWSSSKTSRRSRSQTRSQRSSSVLDNWDD